MAFWSIYIFHILAVYRSNGQPFNQFIKETGPNGEDIWKSTSDFIPVQPSSSVSSQFGTLRLGQVMSAEFDFIFNGRTNNPNYGFYENFFRIGFDAISRSCTGEGSRYPSFWLSNYSPNDERDYMLVSVSSGSQCQISQKLNGFGIVEVGIKYHIKISFNSTQTMVSVDSWSQTWKKDPILDEHLGKEANVYFMSPKFGGESCLVFIFHFVFNINH